MSADETLTPDYAKAIEFLRLWCPEGRWVVTRIDPKKRKNRPLLTRTFEVADAALCEAWLKEQGDDGMNLYFQVNQLRAVFNGRVRPERKEVEKLVGLHVDVDWPYPPKELLAPDRAADLDAFYAGEHERILAMLKDPTSKGIPPPTCITFSGGGCQAFWALELPRSLNGSADDYEDAALYNKRLEDVFGGDSCHEVAHLMRLVGTINRPNEKKIVEKGRTARLAELIEWHPERVYGIGEFEKATAAVAPSSSATGGAKAVTIDTTAVVRVQDLDAELPSTVPPVVKRIIACGLDEMNTDPERARWSRSEWQWWATCEMARRGVKPEVVYSILLDAGWKISETVRDKGRGAERYALRQVDRAFAQAEAEAEEFQAGEDGKPYKNLHNARLAIRKLGVALEFDEFAERSLIAGLSGFGPQLDDAAVTRMRLEIDERFKIGFTKDWFVDVITDMARKNRRHPVREFLDGLAWDGKPRLDGWLSSYLGVKATDFTRAVGTLVLIAAVPRIRHPGCKFDEMLVLEGPQGGFKSTALKVLAVLEDWFSDDLPLNAKSQQFIEQTVGKWIVEAGELKGMRKGDLEALKSCLSRSLDRARMAYGRLAIERARQFVIIGTTNSRDYLKDATGNRRFWPVLVGEINLDALRRDREQLWAEAAAREAAGASIRLDPSLYDAARVEQEARRVEHPWVQILGEFLNGLEGKLRSSDAWALVGVPEGQRTQEHNLQLGEAMRAIGWEYRQRRYGGSPEWSYVKGDATAQLAVLEVVTGDWNKVVRVQRKGSPDDRPSDDPQADRTFR